MHGDQAVGSCRIRSARSFALFYFIFACCSYLREERGGINDKQLTQEIEDFLGAECFNHEVAKLTKLRPDAKLKPETKQRLSYLARIPFRAIVTTNYNNLLDSDIPSLPSKESTASGDQASAGGGAATAISKGSLNPQHNFEKILRPGPGISRAFSCHRNFRLILNFSSRSRRQLLHR